MHQGGAVPETGDQLDFRRDDHRRVRSAPHVLRGLREPYQVSIDALQLAGQADILHLYSSVSRSESSLK